MLSRTNSDHRLVGPCTSQVALGRRAVVAFLATFWFLDGLLQLQPSQFTTDFSTGLQMNAMAQPATIAKIDLRFGQLIAPHVAIWNSGFALVQLALGVFILLPRSRRAGLLASLPWAGGVWILGEGFGGIATGFAMLPTGAPGAVLLYAAVAVALIASEPVDNRQRLVPILRGVWGATLSAGVVLQLTSRVSPALKLRANFDDLIDGEPHLLGRVDHQLGGIAADHAGVVTAGLILIELAMILAAIAPLRTYRATLPLVALGLLAFWVFGENFAGMLTGSANDVGISPLLGVIALATFPRVRLRRAARIARNPIVVEPSGSVERSFARA